jgi:cell wall-associated NlpC family hydrolase
MVRRVGRRRAAGALLALLAVAAAVALFVGGGGGSAHSSHARATGSRGDIQDTEAAQSFPEPASSGRQKLAEGPEEAAAQASAAADTGPSPGAPSDAEVRRDLAQLERWKRRARAGGTIESGKGGLARTPDAAPTSIADVIAGGNAIATFPYRLGGGHGSFVDDAYDCSGSVSYALAAAGMVDVPLTSGDLMTWGVAGRGRWFTVYANPGHVFMTVGGLRFDTSGRAGRRGSRWQSVQRGSRGFVARHWPGL